MEPERLVQLHHGHAHFYPNNTLANYDMDKLSPEDKIRLEHIKMIQKHKGHGSMHAEMILILMVTLVVSQAALIKWRQIYPHSFHMTTLVGMWIIPLVVSVRNFWWRFVVIWCAFSMITSAVMIRALEKPIRGSTPRLVYKWFLLIFKVSYASGIFFYFEIALSMLGVPQLLGLNAETCVYGGVTCWFYALYYGVLARDIAEICAEKMVSRIGYYQPEGIPARHLDKNMCALCGNQFLVRVGEQGVVENTFQLSCSHVYHEFCIRGWCIVGKKETCPYCHEKVDLKRMFPGPWEKPHLMYGHFLDWLRWLVCWQPLIIFLVQGVNWALGLE